MRSGTFLPQNDLNIDAAFGDHGIDRLDIGGIGDNTFRKIEPDGEVGKVGSRRQLDIMTAWVEPL